MTRSTRTSAGSGVPPRTRQGAILAGVCAGLARRWVVDPTLLRLGFILLSLAWGIGIILYLLLWIAIPLEGTQVRQFKWRARQTFRSMPEELSKASYRARIAWSRADRSAWPRPLNRRWIALGLVAGGAGLFLGSLGVFDWITPLRAAGLGLIAVGAAALMTLSGN